MSNGPRTSAPGGGTEQHDAPLTDDERRQLARMLSDPTFFPVEFRTWLKNYVESAGIEIPASQIVGGGVGPNVALTAGCVIPFAGDVIPKNTLLCNGQAVSRTDYDRLFKAIGTKWGTGDGSTTFNVPDLRDRALYGAGVAVGMGGTDGVAYGSRGGPRHHHTFAGATDNQGSHAHNWGNWTDGGQSEHQHEMGTPNLFMGSTAALGSGGSVRYIGVNQAALTLKGGIHSHYVSGQTDTQGLHGHNYSGATTGGYAADMPSHAGINYVIATGRSV